ncbi:hypothetical protein KUCAC02_005713 [Chaenocephalus aceratus]|uniref:Uncharacterized protein n=1 Tax=Chaenocephalus aceratus TaxID=36190 RepID=A0ACB9WQ41_CHAAC|nr:hypothetical protein KUCAC02_005713 [Chaenocephalus aceratus]
MGKKRGKDKSSREEDDFEITGVKEEACLLEVEQKTDTVKAEDEDNKENKDHPKKNAKKETVVKSQKSGTSEDIGGISVRGLSNLGNTCFFNSVIQNISQTHLLRQTLNKMTEEKIELNIQPVAPSDLESLVLHLDRPGPLTMAMCQLLNEIQESKKGVVTPRELFSQVCKKAARFKGFQQQDSQELLRYLLDGMRAEETKRVSTAIMEVLKGSKKSTDGEQLKTLVKEYEKNGFPKNVVDHVFGGETTSTIMCQQCKTVSVVTEMFLDLSLPVSDEAYRKKKQKKEVQRTSESSQDGRNSPALTNGNDDIPEGSGSKYQQKKAKKQAKKQAKQQKRQTKLDGRVTLDSVSSLSQTESDQTDPADPDAEDGENADNGTNEEATLIGETPAQISVSEEDQKTLETDQDEKEKEEEDDDLVNECDSSATSSVSNRFTALSEEQPSKDSVLDNDNISDMDQEVEQDTELVSEMEKVTLDDAFIEDSLAVDQSMESEEEEAKEYTVVSQDPDLAFHTLATRKAPEKQECSVQSCLFQFTEVETLTQNNSLLCVTCTKRQPNKEKAGASKKNVYTDALKQMLISSPPPVLTLHLKRFQQNGYSICKVNRHVQFPLILDLAPFCAVKCKNLTEGDNQILYSLYGIVEHSGTMRSGHYTAYVKARPECPKLSSNGCTAEDSTRGSWFHVSDTSVQPAELVRTMSLQASRMSVFTFHSAVHSANVLQSLDEQRRRDVLCDVTVLVESRSFRAHCSVLASCSDYFQRRVTNVTRQNTIICLPDGVTVEGFEPLLQFAYTSKLPFTKENIHAIHRSAEILGFNDLESSCFDFLIPKFTAENAVCPMLSLPCPAADKADHPTQFCERDILGMGDVCNQSELSLADCGLPCELSAPGDVSPPELIEPAAQPLPLEAIDQNNLSKASDFHWLKQLDLSSSVGDCPFLRDFGTGDDPAPPPTAPPSQRRAPTCPRSTLGTTQTWTQTEIPRANNKRAAEIQLPFPVEQISALSRSAFQQLLRQHQLTQDQMEFVHDVRRRSKNRVAAQRCRKRKLDGIHHLEIDVKKLKSQKERLLQERAELQQHLDETRQSLCGWFKIVSLESGSDQDHLQLLTKVSSPDAPVSSPSYLGKVEEYQIPIEMRRPVLPHSCAAPTALYVCMDINNSL